MVSNILTGLYKSRFLIVYIFFGICSLVVEEIFRNFLDNYINKNLGMFLSITLSISFAYYLNSQFNFKVPKKRLRLSMFYFVLVSFFSVAIQIAFSELASINFINNRYLISGTLFLIAYFLHLKFSFKEKQNTGIAIHLNSINNIDEIYKKVGNLPDFIHIDLIDATYNSSNISTEIEIISKIKDTWPNKKLQLHIMSDNPESWLEKIPCGVDEVFVHLEIGKNKIESLTHKEIGIVVDHNAKDNDIAYVLEKFSKVMVLCIEVPGISGQKYFDKIDKKIELINKNKINKNIKVVLDGGMTPKIASKHYVDEIVTASSVLENKFSKLQLSKFQTSKQYVQ